MIKLQWGDPPKPFLWEVHISGNRAKITSPLLKDLSFQVRPEYGEFVFLAFSESFSYYRKELYSFDTGTLGEALREMATHKFYTTYVKEVMASYTKNNVKVASNNIKAMWGDPPKPYLWKVENTERKGSYATFRIRSPLLKRGLPLYVFLDETDTGVGYIKVALGEYWLRRPILGNDLNEIIKNAFSHKEWERTIKVFLEGHSLLKDNMKVASNNIKVMWGDPPKPFLWEIELVRVSDKEALYFVDSPLLTKILRVGIKIMGSEWELTLEKGSMLSQTEKVYIPHNDMSVKEIAKDVFSPRWWKSLVLPYIQKTGLLKDNMKVASSKIKAMWGDPPKPFLWDIKVLSDMKGKKVYRVSSPLLRNSFFVHLDDLSGEGLDYNLITLSNDSVSGYSESHKTKVQGLAKVEGVAFSQTAWEHIVKRFVLGHVGLRGDVKLASED